MQAVNRFSCETWISSIESHYTTGSGKRPLLPLFEVVGTLKEHIEKFQTQLNESQKIDLVQKIQTLSEEKLKYYRTSRFGWIKEFFSCLRNAWKYQIFKSSGQLGLELSQELSQQKKMMDTFGTVWSLASDMQRQVIKQGIQAIFGSILQQTRVVSWKSNNGKDYELELEREVRGSATLVVARGARSGELIIAQNVKVTFSEEQNPQTRECAQIVHFREGVFCEVEMGFWGKHSIAVPPVSITQNVAGNIEGMINLPYIGLVRGSPKDLLNLFGKIQWQ